MADELVPLSKAVADLARVLQIITEKGNVNEALTEVFSDSINNERALVAAGVDRRLHFLNNARHTVANCKEQIDKWTAAKKTITNVIERLEEYTESSMRAFPEVKFKGTEGEFKIVKNGGAQKLMINVPTQERTYRHCITDPSGIGQQFLIELRGLALNTTAIRQALDNGEQLTFAHLEPRGERLSY